MHNSSSGISRIKAVVFASLVYISADVHIQEHVVEHNHTTMNRKKLICTLSLHTTGFTRMCVTAVIANNQSSQ